MGERVGEGCRKGMERNRGRGIENCTSRLLPFSSTPLALSLSLSLSLSLPPSLALSRSHSPSPSR